jgi:hypothetical protein
MGYEKRLLHRATVILNAYDRERTTGDVNWYNFALRYRVESVVLLNDLLDQTTFKNRSNPGADQPCVAGLTWLLNHCYATAVALEETSESYNRATENIGMTSCFFALLSRDTTYFRYAPTLIQSTMLHLTNFDRIVANRYAPKLSTGRLFQFRCVGCTVVKFLSSYTKAKKQYNLLSESGVNFSDLVESYLLELF